MLQQTQVTTVVPYFNRFIKEIPTLEKLSNINNRKLIKLWEGLGYYSRVRNLKKTAKIIIRKFNNKLPDNFFELKSLPGIGDYTATSILAIVFNKPVIPLDGNVERVLKRYLYLKKKHEIDKASLHEKKKIFAKSNRPGDYAQALMELGAIVCRPLNPLCNQCPINKNCQSFIIKDFTVKKITKKKINKYFLIKVYKQNNNYLLIKNTKFNFLKNLNIFPMDEIFNPKNFKSNFNFKMSNMNMKIKFISKKSSKKMPFSNWIDPENIKKYILPTFTKKIINYLENH